MQIRNQWKGSKNWNVVTGVATVATLGFGAIAVAAPDSNDVPHAINLNDRAVVSEQSSVPIPGGFVPFDISTDDSDASPSPSPDASVSPDTTISAQDHRDASPFLDDSPSVDESISTQVSLDASPQASIDDSISVQEDSDSVSNDSFDDSNDSD